MVRAKNIRPEKPKKKDIAVKPAKRVRGKGVRGRLKIINPFFEEDNINKLKALASTGVTIQQASAIFGISLTKMYVFLSDVPEASQAYHAGKAIGIAKVAKSVSQQAADGNIQAAIFYLRTQAGWTEKVDVVHSGNVNLNHVVSRIDEMTDDQIDERIKQLNGISENQEFIDIEEE